MSYLGMIKQECDESEAEQDNDEQNTSTLDTNTQNDWQITIKEEFNCNTEIDLGVDVVVPEHFEFLEHITYTCDICSEKLFQDIDLCIHMRSHRDYSDSFKMVRCNHCKYIPVNIYDLATHIKSHSMDEDSFNCHVCDFSSIDIYSLSVHLDAHVSDPVYKHYSFDWKRNRVKAKQRKSQDKLKYYTCKVCNYRCLKRRSLEVHMFTHTGKRSFPCNLCDFRGLTLRELKRHWTRHMQKTKLVTPHVYKCKFCPFKTGNDQFALERHMKSHTDMGNTNKPFTCMYCKCTFRYMTALWRHIRIHTGEEPYSCNKCKYTCSTLSSLKMHEQTHTGEKAYECAHCAYITRHRRNIVLHTKKHEEALPCTKQNTLTFHSLTNTGEKKHLCKNCDCATEDVSDLVDHMQKHAKKPSTRAKLKNQKNVTSHKLTHTEEKPHLCTHCDYVTEDLNDLVVHMQEHTKTEPKHEKLTNQTTITSDNLTHTEEKLVLCKHCDYVTEDLNNLVVHMQKHTKTEPKHEKLTIQTTITSDNLTHTEEKPHLCKHCDYVTEDLSNLLDHMKKHTKTEPENEKLTNQNTSTSHEQRNTEKKPHLCKNCDYATDDSTDLVDHMQKHAKEHPLKLACLYCKFKCSKRSQLSEHLRSHDAYHRCAECGYATLARQTYEAHVRSHDKSLACYACDYVCTTAGDRAAHARTHCNEKPFQCLSCGVGFHRKYQLQRHRGERMCARANTLGQLTQLE